MWCWETLILCIGCFGAGFWLGCFVTLKDLLPEEPSQEFQNIVKVLSEAE